MLVAYPSQVEKPSIEQQIICQVFSLFTKQQISRLIQIESNSRQQNKCNSKTEILFGIRIFGWVENILGKGENAGDQ